MEKISFNDLQNKVCIITGGGGVIGSTIAKGLAGNGVKVGILDIDKKIADKIVSEIAKETSTEVYGIAADVLKRDSLERALEEIHSKLGKIDLLINGAGGNSPKATTQFEFMEPGNAENIEGGFFGLDVEAFKNVFDLNFLGTLLPTMVFTKDMVEKGKGSILNISSMNAFKPLTKIPAYSAAKSSINNFTEWLAVHFAKMNIRVNAIAPGFFLTSQNEYLLMDEQTNQLTKRGNKIISNTPMGKFGKPDDLQGTVLYLLSDISNFVTGVVIPVDGGFNAFSGV
jgi:NAD(P)-dependent dehydrogenase (short-subunit alcohol dehydrogenase family)